MVGTVEPDTVGSVVGDGVVLEEVVVGPVVECDGGVVVVDAVVGDGGVPDRVAGGSVE